MDWNEACIPHSMPQKPVKHPEKALTDMTIRNLTSPGRYADGNGLYIVVTKSGAKQWVQRLTVNGRRRDIGLGGYSYTTLADARAKAIEMKSQARNGLDPIAIRNEAQRIVPTFADAARQVHKQNALIWKNPKQRAQWITTLETYAFPTIGRMKVGDIRSSHIHTVLLPIWVEKHETANRVRQRMAKVFDWAKAKEYMRIENPVSGIQESLPKIKRKRSHFAALPYTDVANFISRLQTEVQSPNSRLALEFLILNATRSGELRHAVWDEIDFQARTWEIPASRMKMGLAHHIPLADRSKAILEQARDYWGHGSLIFPSALYPSKPMSAATLNKIAKDMGYSITVHGFRSTFRDWASETRSYPNDVVEMALAHGNPNKTEAAYKRGNLFEKRKELMADWARYCEDKKRRAEITA